MHVKCPAFCATLRRSILEIVALQHVYSRLRNGLSVAKDTLPRKPNKCVAVLSPSGNSNILSFIYVRMKQVVSDWQIRFAHESWINLILAEIGRNAGEIWPREEIGRGPWNRESPAKIGRVGKYARHWYRQIKCNQWRQYNYMYILIWNVLKEKCL